MDLKIKQDFTLIIFGGSGSLAQLKLFPAIYELAKEKRMPKNFQIIAYARSEMSRIELMKQFENSVRKAHEYIDEAALQEVLKNLHYFRGEYDKKEDYQKLRDTIIELEGSKKHLRLAYFAVPPLTFDGILKSLHAVNFNTEKEELRLIIEKPFGHDLSSAKKLRNLLVKYFSSEQIYLLDHYLGKESVGNLLALRYANPIIANLMHSEFVSNIQITAMENVDIEGRAHYFDEVGTVRDMLQSHLLQVIAYLTMFAPLVENADGIHAEKMRILKSIKAEKTSLIVAQYDGYTDAKDIPKNSKTETYFALKVGLSHPLWKNVPIYIRSGKALKQKWTAVVIEFKPRASQRKHEVLAPNRLLIQMQPNEKIEFHLLTKLGGKSFEFTDLITGRPIFCSGDCLSEHGRLLVDVMNGKKDLFLHFDEIFAAWKMIDSLKHGKLRKYAQKSLGPKEADSMILKDGFNWFNQII